MTTRMSKGHAKPRSPRARKSPRRAAPKKSTDRSKIFRDPSPHWNTDNEMHIGPYVHLSVPPQPAHRRPVKYRWYVHPLGIRGWADSILDAKLAAEDAVRGLGLKILGLLRNT